MGNTSSIVKNKQYEKYYEGHYKKYYEEYYEYGDDEDHDKEGKCGRYLDHEEELEEFCEDEDYEEYSSYLGYEYVGYKYYGGGSKFKLELSAIEQEELELLIDEVSSKGFTESAQLSKYIVDNKLGYKYQNISGILEMQGDKHKWEFDGGFPPKIYREVCEALDLSNNRSKSSPVGFTPYKDLLQGEALL